MGMFDTIINEYKLPLPDNMRELNESHFNHGADANYSWQTKSLNCTMTTYKIGGDGLLYELKHEGHYVEGDSNAKSHFDRLGHFERTKEWYEPFNHTGTIEFYDSVRSDKFNNDHWIVYEAKFVDGKVESVVLKSFEVESNAERKRTEQLWNIYHALEDEFERAFFYKYFYKWYKFCVRKVFRAINRLGQFLSNTYAFESKLDFMDDRLKRESGLADHLDNYR